MISIFIGEDDFSLHEAVQGLSKSLGEDAVTRLEGKDLSLDELRNAVMTLPFFSQRRLVIVTGLLSRFERGKDEPPADKGGKDNTVRRWVEVTDNLPPSTTLLLLEPVPRKEIGRHNPLYKAIAPHAQLQEFPRLKGKALREWVVRRTQMLGGSISESAIGVLTWVIGGDLWAMSGELEKLVLFCAGRRIEEDDVRQVVCYSKESSIFELVDSIVEGRYARAYKALNGLLLGGASPSYIIQMLARQIRNLIITRGLKDCDYPDDDVRERLGLAPNYAWRKTLEQANHHTGASLKAIYQRLHDADLEIKGGEYPPQLALETLIAELCPVRPRIDGPQAAKLES